jgi:DNA ligase D-like protein (predicted ligase)
VPPVASRVPVGFIPPLKPTLVREPPTGDGWIHEIKHDGFRTQVALDRGNVRAFTSSGIDWTSRYRRVAAAASKLKATSAIIDGEVAVQDEHGVTDFFALRGAMEAEPYRLIFFAFDLLHLDGKDLQATPLIERRALLRKLLGKSKPTSAIQFSEHVETSGAEFFKAAAEMGLEGIISKRATSRYKSGASKAWLKIKAMDESELVLVGSKLDERKIPTLLLAREVDGHLEYAGSAILALNAEMRERLRLVAEEIKIDKPAVRDLKTKGAWWFRPELRIRVRHLRGQPVLRHATATAIVGRH